MAALKAAPRSKAQTRRDSEFTPNLPAFQPPQKATLHDDLPRGADSLFEIKEIRWLPR